MDFNLQNIFAWILVAIIVLLALFLLYKVIVCFSNKSSPHSSQCSKEE